MRCFHNCFFVFGVGGSGRSALECTTFENRAVARAIAVELWLPSSKYDADDDDDDDDPRARSGNPTPVGIVHSYSPEHPDRIPEQSDRAREEPDVVMGLATRLDTHKTFVPHFQQKYNSFLKKRFLEKTKHMKPDKLNIFWQRCVPRRIALF